MCVQLVVIQQRERQLTNVRDGSLKGLLLDRSKDSQQQLIFTCFQNCDFTLKAVAPIR